MTTMYTRLFIFFILALASAEQPERPRTSAKRLSTGLKTTTTSTESAVNVTSVSSTAAPVALTQLELCAQIDGAFINASKGEPPACHCLPDSMGALHQQSTDGEPAVWISCTRQIMPSIVRPLTTLPPNTLISRIWIWNSIFTVILPDMFARVQPSAIAIENSTLSDFRKGVLSTVGKRLKVLSLKYNILRNIERWTFADVGALTSLDISSNKLTELRKGQFDNLRLLENLQLSGNQIIAIEDGTFESLGNLKVLNLQGNRLVNISKDTFRGLTNLESLNLNGNNINHIDREAFAHMKRLRVLNIGSNKITDLELRSLPALEDLYLYNNSISGLERASLQDLGRLRVLNLDRNTISQLTDGDFLMLARGGNGARLTALSLAHNNISEISCRAFDNLSRLDVLSLQQNRIKTLLCPETILVQSVLCPLQNLRKLFLSGNAITSIDDGDLNILPNLKELTLDHNQIQSISQSAFKGLNLTKLFLNKNRLYYLPEGLFDSWDKKTVEAVDLSDNPRECICDREWVDNWLRDLGLANVGSFGCSSRCGDDKAASFPPGGAHSATVTTTEPFEDHSFWITVIAGILAVVALIFLIAASYIYMQANCYPLLPNNGGLSLRNVPSDMIRLIQSQESLLSFPNPIANGPNGPELLLKPAPPPQPISSISINIGHDLKRNTDSTDSSLPANGGELRADKKRVRFDGI